MPKILFLAASPSDAERRPFDEEIRAIQEKVRLSEFRDLFEIKQQLAVRVNDLQGTILSTSPDVIHFSCYARRTKAIVLVGESGESQLVPAEALGRLFGLIKGIGANPRCVVLNACFAKRQAQAISKHVECVIGISGSIKPEAGISFVASFYQAIGYGKSIQAAFALGRNQLEIENQVGAEKLIMLSTTACDCDSIVLAAKDSLDLSRMTILMKLGEGGSTTRSEAARQLGYLREPAAISIIRKRWLKEPDPTVRYWLAIALGDIGGEQGADALRSIMMAEKDPWAQGGIEEALSHIRQT